MPRHRAPAEQTSFGAWVSAAVAMGMYPSYEAALACAVTDPVVYQPNAALAELYEERRQTMNDLYRRIFA